MYQAVGSSRLRSIAVPVLTSHVRKTCAKTQHSLSTPAAPHYIARFRPITAGLAQPVTTPKPLAPQALSLQPTQVHGGNPRYGTLMVLAQGHASVDPNHPLANKFDPTASQASILDTLLRLQPREVFFEGITQMHSDTPLTPQDAELFRTAFAGWHAGKGLNAQQKDLLRQYGAYMAYRALAPQTRFPATEDAAISERLLRGIQNGIPPEEQLALTVTAREKFWVDQFKKHFAEHPGSTAVFVVGAMHDLTRQCDPAKGFDPQVRWYNVSGLPTRFVKSLQNEAYAAARKA